MGKSSRKSAPTVFRVGNFGSFHDHAVVRYADHLASGGRVSLLYRMYFRRLNKYGKHTAEDLAIISYWLSYLVPHGIYRPSESVSFCTAA